MALRPRRQRTVVPNSANAQVMTTWPIRPFRRDAEGVSVSIGFGDVISGTLITATVSGLVGGEVVTYQWTDDGSDIVGRTSSTYTATIGTDGIADVSQIRVVVTVDGTSYTSNGRRIIHSVGAFGALSNQSLIKDSNDQTYEFPAATGTGLTWIYALVSPISGVTIDSGTRTITFDTNSLAVQSGTVITVRATDQYGRQITQTFTLAIALRAQATAANGIAAQTWTVSVTSVNLNAAADFTPNGNTLTYSATGLAAGVTINASTGLISGTPTAASSGNVVVTATDEYGRQTTSTFSQTTSLPAVGSFGALANQTWARSIGTQPYEFPAAAGESLTWTYALVTSQAGVTIDSASRTVFFNTDVLAIQSGTTFTVSATDQFGRAATGSPRSATFTITELDTVAPTATSVSAGNQSGSNVPVTVLDLSEPATTFWVFVPGGSSAPSASQIIAGNNASSTPASAAGNFEAVPSSGPYNADFGSLDGTFDLYVVFRDAGLNVSPVYSSLAVEIASGEAINSVTYDAGGVIIDYTGTLSVTYDAGGIVLEAA